MDSYFLEVIHDFLRVDEANNLKMASLICFFYLYSIISEDVLPMNITVESEIPIGAGLGSSAALSVCLAAGLLAIKQERQRSQEMVQQTNKNTFFLLFLGSLATRNSWLACC